MQARHALLQAFSRVFRYKLNWSARRLQLVPDIRRAKLLIFKLFPLTALNVRSCLVCTKTTFLS